MSQPDDSPTPVGQQLADRRDELDLTQARLAQAIGVTTTTISATENGRTQISRSKRPLWEQALSLQPGTIGRAYRTGSRIEPLDAELSPATPYADLSDTSERAIWEMRISEEDRRTLIDILRSDRRDSGRRTA